MSHEPPTTTQRPPTPQRLPRLALTLARFCASAWVGAATLFIVTGVQEVRSPALDSTTKDHLAAIRFPTYYAFGFALLTAALVSGVLARSRRHGAVAIFALLALALTLMLIDYVWIYGPLHAIVSAPTEARPANFQTYHRWTMTLGGAHLLLCLTAAVLLCRPISEKAE